jgi:hypothetical protein
MFDQALCDHLEYAISGALGKSGELDSRRCWCDGVILPEDPAAYSKELIASDKLVVTKAWIDEGRIKNKVLGQFLYEMRLYFGNECLEKLHNNERLEHSVPTGDPDSWILFDWENKVIEIQLP